MSLQLLINICHVSNAELKQKERNDYVSCCDIIIDEVCENKHNVIHNDVKIEKAQFINDEDIENNNMLITSFKFIDLSNLSDFEIANSLMQIHTCIH